MKIKEKDDWFCHLVAVELRFRYVNIKHNYVLQFKQTASLVAH